MENSNVSRQSDPFEKILTRRREKEMRFQSLLRDDPNSYDRLAVAYEISCLFTRFQSIELSLSPIFQLANQFYPFESIVIIQRRKGARRIHTWASLTSSEKELEHLERTAARAFQNLVESDYDEFAPETVYPHRTYISLSALATSSEPIFIPFISKHRPVFGALQIHGARKPTEIETAFLDVLGEQLKFALEQQYGWLDELQIRENVEKERNLQLVREKAINEDLIRSNAELQQFASVASHDLKEPARTMYIYTSLLLQRLIPKADPETTEFLKFIADGSKRMTALIDDLLCYARIGSFAQESGPIDCNQVIQSVLKDLKRMIQQKQAIVTYDPLPYVYAPRAELVQLFTNLLSNALKFQADATPKVHIACDMRGSECIFSVSDNGIGIEPEQLQNIFVLFRRLHGREAYPGTGIGLAICKKIVERHRGRIWVESEVGRGSSFCFTFPCQFITESHAAG